MNLAEAIPVIVLGIAFIVDVQSTVDLWGRYRRVGPTLIKRERLILQAFVVVSVIITIVAGYFGALATRRLMGFDALDMTAGISWVLAITTLFVPAYLKLTVKRVAGEPKAEAGQDGALDT